MRSRTRRRVTTAPKGGFTLAELLIAIAIVSGLFVAVAGLVYTCLRAETVQTNKSSLYSEGMLAMERMVAGVKVATFVHIPNNHQPIRDMLAFSGTVNDDNDHYFDDTIFARIDEDPGSDMSNDSFPGIASYDDDGDGTADEPGGLAWSDAIRDDDEDGVCDEDWLDGLDNDGDGNIDEDVPAESNADLVPGLEAFDDDGDGLIDEGAGVSDQNDDEDDLSDEDEANPVIYEYDSVANTLSEIFPHTGTLGILSDKVTAFTVVYTPPDCFTDPFITISLTLTNDDGESVTLAEIAYPRNTVQKWGKRTR